MSGGATGKTLLAAAQHRLNFLERVEVLLQAGDVLLHLADQGTPTAWPSGASRHPGRRPMPGNCGNCAPADRTLIVPHT